MCITTPSPSDKPPDIQGMTVTRQNSKKSIHDGKTARVQETQMTGNDEKLDEEQRVMITFTFYACNGDFYFGTLDPKTASTHSLCFVFTSPYAVLPLAALCSTGVCVQTTDALLTLFEERRVISSSEVSLGDHYSTGASDRMAEMKVDLSIAAELVAAEQLMVRLGFSSTQQMADAVYSIQDERRVISCSGVSLSNNSTGASGLMVRWKLNLTDAVVDISGAVQLVAQCGECISKQMAGTVYSLQEERRVISASGVSLGDHFISGASDRIVGWRLNLTDAVTPRAHDQQWHALATVPLVLA